MAQQSTVVAGTGINRPALGAENYKRTALDVNPTYGPTPYAKAIASVQVAQQNNQLTPSETSYYSTIAPSVIKPAPLPASTPITPSTNLTYYDSATGTIITPSGAYASSPNAPKGSELTLGSQTFYKGTTGITKDTYKDSDGNLYNNSTGLFISKSNITPEQQKQYNEVVYSRQQSKGELTTQTITPEQQAKQELLKNYVSPISTNSKGEYTVSAKPEEYINAPKTFNDVVNPILQTKFPTNIYSPLPETRLQTFLRTGTNDRLDSFFNLPPVKTLSNVVSPVLKFGIDTISNVDNYITTTPIVPLLTSNKGLQFISTRQAFDPYATYLGKQAGYVAGEAIKAPLSLNAIINPKTASQETYDTFSKGTGVFTSSATEQILKDLEQNPVKNALIYGSGYAFGSVLKGYDLASEGYSAGARAVAMGTKFTGELGLGLFGLGAGVLGADQAFAQGGISGLGAYTGETAKDLLLFGLGLESSRNGKVSTFQRDLNDKPVMEKEDNDLTLLSKDFFERIPRGFREAVDIGDDLRGVGERGLIDETTRLFIDKDINDFSKIIEDTLPKGGTPPKPPSPPSGGSGIVTPVDTTPVQTKLPDLTEPTGNGEGTGTTGSQGPIGEPNTPNRQVDYTYEEDVRQIALRNLVEDEEKAIAGNIKSKPVVRKIRFNEEGIPVGYTDDQDIIKPLSKNNNLISPDARPNIVVNEEGIPVGYKKGTAPKVKIEDTIESQLDKIRGETESKEFLGKDEDENLDKALNQFRGDREFNLDTRKILRDTTKNALKNVLKNLLPKEVSYIDENKPLILQRGREPIIEKNPYREAKSPEFKTPSEIESDEKRIIEEGKIKQVEQLKEEDRLREISLRALDTKNINKELKTSVTTQKKLTYFFGEEETPETKTIRNDRNANVLQKDLTETNNQILEKTEQPRVLTDIETSQKKLSDSLFNQPTTNIPSQYSGLGLYERSATYADLVYGLPKKIDNTKVNVGNFKSIDLGGKGSNLGGMSSNLGGPSSYAGIGGLGSDLNFGLGTGQGQGSGSKQSVTSSSGSGISLGTPQSLFQPQPQGQPQASGEGQAQPSSQSQAQDQLLMQRLKFDQDQDQDESLREFEEEEEDELGLIRTSKKQTPIKRIRSVPTYTVSVRRQRKFTPIATGVSYGQAVKLGQDKTLNTLARTFKITPSGKSKEEFGNDIDVAVNKNLFRDYQIRKGKTVPLQNIFIQRRSTLLGSFGEKSEIKQARQSKKSPKINLYENL